MTTFRIRVVGRPAPEGSHETGQHGRVMHSSAYLAAWRRAVQIAALRTMGEVLHELPAFGKGVPVHIHSVELIVGDDQCRALGTAEPVGPPDLDKLLRATVDGLGDGKVFENDSQVLAIWGPLQKRRTLPGEEPGAIIIISDERPSAAGESSDMQEYQLSLSKVTTDEDGDRTYSTMLEVCGTQAELGIVLPAVSAMLGLAMPTAGVSLSVAPTAPAETAEQATAKRTRRTKAEIEAAKAAEAAPVPAAAPAQTEGEHAAEQFASGGPIAPVGRVNPFAVG